jgi:FkbM family methyltransferase
MSSYRTHLNRLHVNRKMCAAGPDRLGYLKSWYLSRLKQRVPRFVPDGFILRMTERGRVLSLPTRYNTDDALVLRGIFAEREYDTELITGPIHRVLDLGSHCGYSAAYWSARFPDATFACIEPDPRNLTQLQQTIALNDIRATVFAAAVAPVSGCRHLRSSSPSLNSVVGEATNLVVPVITIDQIYAAMGWVSVDLIKMDVEGMEYELVTEAGTALRHSRFIVFELHSWVDGDAVKQGLRNLGFTLHHVNEVGEQVYLAVNQGNVAD